MPVGSLGVGLTDIARNLMQVLETEPRSSEKNQKTHMLSITETHPCSVQAEFSLALQAGPISLASSMWCPLNLWNRDVEEVKRFEILLEDGVERRPRARVSFAEWARVRSGTER